MLFSSTAGQTNYVMIIHCLLLSIIGTVFSEKCGQGVLQLSNQCAIVKQTGNGIGYFAADLECLAMGGKLLSIHNEQANTAIAEYATGVNDTNHFYIGGVGRRDGVWEWRDGTEMDYTNWAKGEPAESGVCITIHLANYQWYATDCERAIPSVCGIPFSSGSTTTPTIPTTTTTTTTGCPPTWKEYKQNCYAIFGQEKGYDYEEGRDLCVAYGGELASIHSKEENDMIKDIVYPRSFDKDLAFPYIGLYWNGTFSWTDGSPFTFDHTAWTPIGNSHIFIFHENGQWEAAASTKVKGSFVCKMAARSWEVRTSGST